MPTTSNFGWTTPADTDLVKDGAAAIRTLGNGIDTSLVDLKGGTTGQILSKNSNTDLDYTWINNDQGDLTAVSAGVGITVTNGTGPIPTITNSSTDLITTAGDILYGTAADTVARLGIGTAGQVLTVNSGATAPEWKTASAGTDTWTLLNAGGTALTGATTVTVSGISNVSKLLIRVDNASSANALSYISVRLNTDTGNNYPVVRNLIDLANTYSDANFYADHDWTANSIVLGRMGNAAGNVVSGIVTLTNCTSTSYKPFISNGAKFATADDDARMYWGQGFYIGTSAITSVSVVSSTGNLDNGSVFVYGA